jgi:hypothetical protein
MIIRMEIMDMNTGDEGVLQYDDNPKQTAVQWGLFEGPVELRDKLTEYFATKQTFKIAKSDGIDDYERAEGLPTEDVDFFQLSLCKMFLNIDVRLGKVLNVKEED